ncbi:macro domain-containing protein, partial [Singulisphaera rosea]
MRLTLVKPLARDLPGELLRVSLCDKNPDVVRAFLEHFHDVEGVEILEGNVLDLECDALLSPANSFGYMDGGFDKHIDDFYQGEAQRAVLSAIAERHFGELPVGLAILLEMPSRRFPCLVVAPTMRIPGAIRETLNAYLALRAAFIAIEGRNSAGGQRIRSL